MFNEIKATWTAELDKAALLKAAKEADEKYTAELNRLQCVGVKATHGGRKVNRYSHGILSPTEMAHLRQLRDELVAANEAAR